MEDAFVHVVGGLLVSNRTIIVQPATSKHSSASRVRAVRARIRASATSETSSSSTSGYQAIAGDGTLAEALERMPRELEMIEQWEKSKKLGKADPWGLFLRGCVFSRADKPQLALKHFKHALEVGFVRGYEPHYRTAAALFRCGDVQESAKEWSEGLKQSVEMVGNLLHFGHRFETEFGPYTPPWYGPSRALQQGVCYYCRGWLSDARRAFVLEHLMQNGEDIDIVLWYLATSVKRSSRSALREKLEVQLPEDESIVKLWELFTQQDENMAEAVFSDLQTLAQRTTSDGNRTPAYVAFYLALYRDAYCGDVAARDELLQFVLAGAKPEYEFLWYASRNRLSSNEPFDVPLPQ